MYEPRASVPGDSMQAYKIITKLRPQKLTETAADLLSGLNPECSIGCVV
jgi:hypothetical protein